MLKSYEKIFYTFRKILVLITFYQIYKHFMKREDFSKKITENVRHIDEVLMDFHIYDINWQTLTVNNSCFSF